MLGCSVKTFLDHYAPFSPSPETADYVYKRVKEDCLIEAEFPREPPAKGRLGLAPFGGGPSDFVEEESRSVSRSFSRLVETMNILQCLDLDDREPGRQLNFLHEDSLSSMTGGELGGSEEYNVDAFLRHKNADSQESEEAVIAKFELASQYCVFQENRRQLVSAASQIMNDDPRRMWIYGVTIENAEMSLWYFSRSHSVKSKAFDWTRDFKTFVRVLISFMFATEKEIGFDPTVHRMTVKGNIQYIYQVDDKFFLTVEPIFNPRVLCISGRKTRVWRAVEVRGPLEEDVDIHLNNGKEYAVKDVWLDEGSDTEGGILRKIFASLETQTVTEYKWMSKSIYDILEKALDGEHYKRYFMEIVCDMQGETTKSPAKGAVVDPGILDMSPVEQTQEEVNKSIRKGSTSNARTPKHSGLSGSPYQSNAPPPNCGHVAKFQYRLVYNDVGIPLHDAPNLGSCFNALCDALIALVLMAFANWVHRDVSTGNIIVLQNDDGTFRGRLSDLEYARKFNSDSVDSKDTKTGTPYFMPYEIHSNTLVHGPRPMNYSSSIDPRKRMKAERRDYTLPSCPSFYRYEYDVESLWWIIVWTVFTRIPHEPAQELSRDVFRYTTEPSQKRTQLFKNQRDRSIKDAMPPVLEVIADSIYTMHEVLNGSYVVIPATFQQYLVTHSQIWDLLEEIVEFIGKKTIPNLALSGPDSKRNQDENTSIGPIREKRQREDSNEDAIRDESTGGEVEAAGSHKRPRLQCDNGATADESAHPALLLYLLSVTACYVIHYFSRRKKCYMLEERLKGQEGI